MDFIYQPIIESDGVVSGIFVEGIDVTEHVNAENHLSLINDELKHRVKNTLAMVSAIASQTLRNTGNDGQLTVFHNRLEMFGKAHDILTSSSSLTASIRDVVDAALAPYRTAQGRFSISGQDTELGTKQALSLALALHELATNATKYGALSNQTGRVDIHWERVKSDGMTGFLFQWRKRTDLTLINLRTAGSDQRLFSGYWRLILVQTSKSSTIPQV